MKIPEYEKTILRNRAFDRMVEAAKAPSQQQEVQTKPSPERSAQPSDLVGAER